MGHWKSLYTSMVIADTGVPIVFVTFPGLSATANPHIRNVASNTVTRNMTNTIAEI